MRTHRPMPIAAAARTQRLHSTPGILDLQAKVWLDMACARPLLGSPHCRISLVRPHTIDCADDSQESLERVLQTRVVGTLRYKHHVPRSTDQELAILLDAKRQSRFQVDGAGPTSCHCTISRRGETDSSQTHCHSPSTTYFHSVFGQSVNDASSASESLIYQPAVNGFSGI